MNGQASHLLGPDEQLSEARRHAEELRAMWRAANGPRPAAGRGASGGWLRRHRLALGEAMVRLGQAMTEQAEREAYSRATNGR